MRPSWNGEMNGMERDEANLFVRKHNWGCVWGRDGKRWHVPFTFDEDTSTCNCCFNTTSVAKESTVGWGVVVGVGGCCRKIVWLTIDSDMSISVSAYRVSWTNRPLIALWCNSLNKRRTVYLYDVSYLYVRLPPTHPCEAVFLQSSIMKLYLGCVLSFPALLDHSWHICTS